MMIISITSSRPRTCEEAQAGGFGRNLQVVDARRRLMRDVLALLEVGFHVRPLSP
jgi:hypothetical protein